MPLPNKGQLEKLFCLVIAEAKAGVVRGHGGPFGAVVARNGRPLAAAHNTVLRDADPTAHAEVNAIRKAAKKAGRPHLRGCVLITTSEPCPLCLAAAYWAGLAGIYYCLPKSVAARQGFSDAFIYHELGKPLRSRSIKEVRFGGSRDAVLEVFRDWRRRGGKLY